MGWVKIDDGLYDHRKIRKAGSAAVGDWLKMLSFCARHRTNGRLELADFGLLSVRPRSRERLIEVGLLDRIDAKHYAIHDYLDYNPSREEMEQIQESRSRAGKRGGRKSAANRQALASTDSKQLASTNLNPVPSRPVPSQERDESLSTKTEAFASGGSGPVERVDQITQLVMAENLGLPLPGHMQQTQMLRLLPMPRETVLHAVDQLRTADMPNWKYLLRCLENPGTKKRKKTQAELDDERAERIIADIERREAQERANATEG